MDLSIIILNYKQKGLLKQCIKGIVSVQPQLDYEIMVVDNNSNDDSLVMVEGLFKEDLEIQSPLPISNPLIIPSIVTIQSEVNGGFARGNNLAIKQAKGKYIMILNPDIAVISQALEKMVGFMDQDDKIGAIGPRLINPDGSVQYSCRRWPNFLTPLYRRTFFGNMPSAKKSVGSYLMKDFDHQRSIDVDWLFAACLLVRKSAFDQVGLFDERFFMYFEDLDLCRRFWEKGLRVMFYADVEMVHYHQQLSAQYSGLFGVFSKGGRIHVKSGIKYFAKYFGTKLPDKAGQNG